jgi:membrane-bound ClpP family serine protease
MQMMRRFWDAAIALDASAIAMDEGSRAGICQPRPLEQLFAASGLEHVEVQAVDIPTTFADFDDYWTSNTGLAHPSAKPIQAMSAAEVEQLKASLRERLPTDAEDSITYMARANAVKGRVPE